MKIKIEYNGNLVVYIDNKIWIFPDYCLLPQFIDDAMDKPDTTKSWEITCWPRGFPNELKNIVLSTINDVIARRNGHESNCDKKSKDEKNCN